MIFLIQAAFAAPTMCDPTKDTAPISADGFCLTADEYAELGRLRRENQTLKSSIDSREAELTVFEQWKVAHDAQFEKALGAVREESIAGATQCTARVEEAERRSVFERFGFPIGVTVTSLGVVGVLILAH